MLTPHQIQESSGNSLERRVRSRQKLRSVSYIDLGPDNGGLVLNVSESGLAFSCAMKLTGDELPDLSFKLPGISDAIETQARLVWISESRKEAGVQFEGLLEEDARRINDWIMAEQGLHSQLEEAAVSSTELAAVDAAPRAASKPKDNYTAPPPFVPSAFTPEIPRLRESGLGGLEMPYSGRESVGPALQRPPKRALAVSIPIFGAVAILAFVAGLAMNHRGQPAASKRVEQVASPVTQNVEKSTSNGTQAATDKDIAKAPESQQAAGEPTTTAGSGNANGGSESSVVAADPVKTESKPRATKELPTRPEAVRSAAATKPSGSSPSGGDRGTRERAKTKSVSTSETAQRTANVPRSDSAPADVSVSRNDAKYLQEEAAAEQALERASAAGATGAPASNGVASSASTTSDTGAGKTAAPAAPVEPAKLPSGSVEVHVPPFPSMRIPAELKSQAAAGGQSLQMGQLISSAQPEYPRDALSQQVQGTVKAHVEIGSEGAVEAVHATGPPALVEAATAALRQWRYKPTRVNGTAIPAEEDVVFVFRLSDSSAK